MRAAQKDLRAIENPTAWLTTIVSRLCLDTLAARRRRNAEPWQEESAFAVTAVTAEDQRLVAESVGLALLVVLERLSPLERVAFVLHDAFALPFEEIARVIDRSVVATKKLASRARQRVYGAPVSERVARDRAVVEEFLAAARSGDVEALVAVLAPDVVRRADSVARGEGMPAELRGADAVAEEIAANQARATFARVVLVDGGVGAVVAPFGKLRFVLRFTLAGERIRIFEVLGTKEALESLDLRLLPP
nr:MAG: RNA polymerase subunit sigma-70 [Pseudomonadota bacterium]